MSDSDSDDSQECIEPPKEAPPTGTTGLALAEHYFGPLLSPVAATPAQWEAYTSSRLDANSMYGNASYRKSDWHVHYPVSTIEDQLGLTEGTLRKCISTIERDDSEFLKEATFVRIYSPATPMYVDVHFKYRYLPLLRDTEWYYSLGYKIHNCVFGPPVAPQAPSTKNLPGMWHTQQGWQSVCWAYYDSERSRRYPGWRRIEVADMGLHEEGVLELHEALFGPIDAPPTDDTDAVLAYRRTLVATVRLLFAAVGISCKVSCTEGEKDEMIRTHFLEGLSDRWITRGIRAACGFQLSHDPEAARLGEEERAEQARGGLVAAAIAKFF